MRRILNCLVIALMPVVANAEFLSGNDLKQRLEAYTRIVAEKSSSLEDAQKGNLAMGYIAGIWDYGYGSAFCGGSTITVGQVVAVVKKYLDEHPAEWSKSADILVSAALRQSFPCKK